MAFSPDGQKFACSGNGKIQVWNAELDHLRMIQSGTVVSLDFSSNGQQIAGSCGDRTIKIWDSDSGNLLKTLKGHESLVMAVEFSRDGRYLISMGGMEVKLWDADSGAEVRTLGERFGGFSVAFSPDSRQLALSSARGLKFWDADTGTELRTFDINSDLSICSKLAFSENGRQLASGGCPWNS